MTFILSGAGLLTMYLAPRYPLAAWVWALAIQPVWVWYSWTTEQWGFLLTTVVYCVIYARNLRLELR